MQCIMRLRNVEKIETDFTNHSFANAKHLARFSRLVASPKFVGGSEEERLLRSHKASI